MTTQGTDFPPFRREVLKYTDSIGIEYIAKKFKELQAINKARLQVSSLLTKLVKENALQCLEGVI